MCQHGCWRSACPSPSLAPAGRRGGSAGRAATGGADPRRHAVPRSGRCPKTYSGDRLEPPQMPLGSVERVWSRGQGWQSGKGGCKAIYGAGRVMPSMQGRPVMSQSMPLSLRLARGWPASAGYAHRAGYAGPSVSAARVRWQGSPDRSGRRHRPGAGPVAPVTGNPNRRLPDA